MDPTCDITRGNTINISSNKQQVLFLMDKDWAQINAAQQTWPTTKIQDGSIT